MGGGLRGVNMKPTTGYKKIIGEKARIKKTNITHLNKTVPSSKIVTNDIFNVFRDFLYIFFYLFIYLLFFFIILHRK